RVPREEYPRRTKKFGLRLHLSPRRADIDRRGSEGRAREVDRAVQTVLAGHGARELSSPVMNTQLPVNSFKQAIREGRPQIGLWSSLCSNLAAEVIAGAGFDWVLLDTEHAPNEVPMVFSQLQALVGGTAAPVVRPAWNDLVLLKRLLDVGA